MDSLAGSAVSRKTVHADARSDDRPIAEASRQTEAVKTLDEGWSAAQRFLGMTNDELRRVDPVVMNLAVAKGIPSQANLDIGRYVQLADRWAAEIRSRLGVCDAAFYEHSDRWQHDLDLCRLSVIGAYVNKVLKIGYREDQQQLTRVLYTDPTQPTFS